MSADDVTVESTEAPAVIAPEPATAQRKRPARPAPPADDAADGPPADDAIALEYVHGGVSHYPRRDLTRAEVKSWVQTKENVDAAVADGCYRATAAMPRLPHTTSAH